MRVEVHHDAVKGVCVERSQKLGRIVLRAYPAKTLNCRFLHFDARIGQRKGCDLWDISVMKNLRDEGYARLLLPTAGGSAPAWTQTRHVELIPSPICPKAHLLVIT